MPWKGQGDMLVTQPGIQWFSTRWHTNSTLRLVGALGNATTIVVDIPVPCDLVLVKCCHGVKFQGASFKGESSLASLNLESILAAATKHQNEGRYAEPLDIESWSCHCLCCVVVGFGWRGRRQRWTTSVACLLNSELLLGGTCIYILYNKYWTGVSVCNVQNRCKKSYTASRGCSPHPCLSWLFSLAGLSA